MKETIALENGSGPGSIVQQMMTKRLESFRELLTGELSPIERRQELLQTRLGALTGSSLQTGDGTDVAEADQTGLDLPDNVDVRGNPDHEALRIAAEEADRFAKVIVFDNGQVKAELHASGSVFEIREPPAEDRKGTETHVGKRSMSGAASDKFSE